MSGKKIETRLFCLKSVVSDPDTDRLAELLDYHASVGLCLPRAKKPYEILLLHARRYACENAMTAILKNTTCDMEAERMAYMRYCFRHLTGRRMPDARRKRSVLLNTVSVNDLPDFPVEIPDATFEEMCASGRSER
ncbi:MAG: hypothetical protein Q4P30_00390 [Eubacteriales bacterium]|nr:hypothetical protein [Eubacteriales bacterium]